MRMTLWPFIPVLYWIVSVPASPGSLNWSSLTQTAKPSPPVLKSLKDNVMRWDEITIGGLDENDYVGFVVDVVDDDHIKNGDEKLHLSLPAIGGRSLHLFQHSNPTQTSLTVIITILVSIFTVIILDVMIMMMIIISPLRSEFSLTSRRVLSIHYRCDDQNDDLKKECVEVDQVGEVSPTDPPLP